MGRLVRGSSYVCSSNVTPDDSRAYILCTELGRPRQTAALRADWRGHHQRRRD